MSISISYDGGKSYSPIEDITPNDGSYSWTVTGPASVNCMMKIELLSDLNKGTVQGLFSLISAIQPVLSVIPNNRTVSKDAGATTFSVSNVGTGSMFWTAQVISGDSWLSIVSGANGTDTGNITCSFNANNGTLVRTGTIRIMANYAIDSPVDVMVTQTTTIYAFPAPVPDTGQAKCYNDTVEIVCPSPGQAFYGQDANYNNNPMSYTKLDNSGNALPDSATSWVTVRDNVTGLIWEMKTNLDGITDYYDPHDADNQYNTTCDSKIYLRIGDFIKALNDAQYGGFSDWRIPTIKELVFIVKDGISASGPTIDSEYFPNTQPEFYCSSTVYNGYLGVSGSTAYGGYWGLDFYDSDVYISKYNPGNAAIVCSGGIVYVRAVRGSQPQSVYVNNGNGTITDTSSGLMWQQSTSNDMAWEQALTYCENLTLAGYTDWRLPTQKEFYSLTNPSPESFYDQFWTSTTYAKDPYSAWLMDSSYYMQMPKYQANKGVSLRACAVRSIQSGQLDHSILSVNPANREVAKDTGTTNFSVSNTGTGTMSWTAAVISGDSWLSIVSGASGTDSGTILCAFNSNTTTSKRTATIRITASNATGSPVDVTVTQAATTLSECTVTLNVYGLLHIPYLSYSSPMLWSVSLWADFVYEFNPIYPNLILFKSTNSGIIYNPSYLCNPSTLSHDLIIHIPDVLLQDGSTRLWMDLEYSPALSTDENSYFYIVRYGSASG